MKTWVLHRVSATKPPPKPIAQQPADKAPTNTPRGRKEDGTPTHNTSPRRKAWAVPEEQWKEVYEQVTDTREDLSRVLSIQSDANRIIRDIQGGQVHNKARSDELHAKHDRLEALLKEIRDNQVGANAAGSGKGSAS